MRLRRDNEDPGGALLAADAPTLLLEPDAVPSPVLRLMLERARAGSRPGARDDDHLLALAVEGGGMRGAVSAGMCVVLEAAGLVPAFDRIYGVSAGALNGSMTAAGQAALGATHYQDAATRRVINPMRPLRGRPVIDFNLLFQELIAARKPISFDRLSSGPEFRALATSLETSSLSVLGGFADADELLQAVRASSALPTLGGPPPVFRDERMADGGLVESIPFETALREGATHVLVLRSRPTGYRQPAYSELAERVALRAHPELRDLLRKRPGTYNRQVDELERLSARRRYSSPLLQIAVPDRTRLIGRLEGDGSRVVDALRLGANAMAAAILADPIDLCWQPVAYRTAVPGAPAAPLGTLAA